MTLDEFDAVVAGLINETLAPDPDHFRSDVYDEEYDAGPDSCFVWQQPPMLRVRMEFELCKHSEQFLICVIDDEGFIVYKHYDSCPVDLMRRALRNLYGKRSPFAGDTSLLDRSLWEGF